MPINRNPLGLVLAVALVLIGSCHPRDGKPCDIEHEGQCKGDDALMVCEFGTWVEVPCRGPAACWYDPIDGISWCDPGWNIEGDNCTHHLEGRYICDGEVETLILVCLSGTFEVDYVCDTGTECRIFDDSIGCTE